MMRYRTVVTGATKRVEEWVPESWIDSERSGRLPRCSRHWPLAMRHQSERTHSSGLIKGAGRTTPLSKFVRPQLEPRYRAAPAQTHGDRRGVDARVLASELSRSAVAQAVGPAWCGQSVAGGTIVRRDRRVGASASVTKVPAIEITRLSRR